MVTVSYVGSRADLRRLLRRLPRLLSGDEPDSHGVVRGVQLRLGVALLSKVQQAYREKARGQRGDDGIQWKPLKPSTMARRRGKGIGGVEILVDTARLVRSFSPGVDDRPSHAPDQVFEMTTGQVVVGTNVKYAVYHHRGTKHVPARPFWPAQLPRRWWEALLDVYRRGVVRAVVRLLENGRSA